MTENPTEVGDEYRGELRRARLRRVGMVLAVVMVPAPAFVVSYSFYRLLFGDYGGQNLLLFCGAGAVIFTALAVIAVRIVAGKPRS